MALSGKLIWGPTGNGAYFSFEWTATQNISARTSTVSWKMYGRGRSSSPTYIASNYYLYINGSTVSSFTSSWDGSSKFSFDNAKKDSGSFTVYHDNSGAGSFDASIYAFISSSGYNWDTVAQTFNLDNIGSLGPYYSWVNLGQTTTPSNNESVSFNLAANQVGYYWYRPPGDGTITVYASSSQDTYGGFDVAVNGTCDMKLSSTQTFGANIVSNASYSNDEFRCTGIPVTGGALAGQVFVHGYNNAVSGTLYIDFTPSNYTVTFDANGGSGAPSAISCVPGASITIPTTKPTKSGKIFLGWGTSSTSAWSDSDRIIGATYTPIGSVTLYAIWGYKLTINPNGGTAIRGSDSSDSIKVTSSSYTVGFTKTKSYGRWLGNFAGGRYHFTDVANFNEPIRTGYTFTGWTVTSGNGSVNYAEPGNSFTSFYDDDRYCWVAGVDDLTENGYYYYVNNETSPTNSTITAQWTPNTYTVTFNANGGGTPSSSTKTVTYNSTYGTLPTISRTNYTFNGWYTEASGGTKITSTSTVSTSSDHTLYAQWTAHTGFTVIFNKNGGNTPSPASKSVTQGSTYGTLATCTRTGYTLKGWYTASSGGTKITSSTTVNLTGNQILYAQWTPITYTIAYNANGGTGTTVSSSHTYDQAKNLTANGFSKFGYTFQGWATSLDRANAGIVDYADKASVSNRSTTSGATVNLYAVWKIYTKVYIYTNKKDGTSKWVPVEKYTYTGS